MAYTDIDDPSAFFQATLYTGNGSHPRNITNDGNSDLKPDFLWLKKRNQAGTDHVLANSSIGWDAPKGNGYPWENGPFGGQMASNSTGAESTPSATYGYISAALTDGFTAAAGGTNGSVANENGKTYVAWQWKSNGGTKANNTTGSIDSVVQANTDAGFSIVTYTGTGGNITVGHGLGVAPNAIIIKSRSNAAPWVVWTSGMAGTTSVMELNATGAEQTVSNYWYNGFSSTTFGLGTGTYSHNTNNYTYVAYCFAEKQGYSKFGKYVGNGNADGPFVYTGFKPAFVMTKRTDSTSGWFIQDIKRGIRNSSSGTALEANTNLAESGIGATNYDIDFLSNGFKLRQSNAYLNASGGSYIYMAFAENPFTTSTGIPTTAR